MSGVVVVLGDALVAALVALLHRVDLQGRVQRDVVPAEEEDRCFVKPLSSLLSFPANPLAQQLLGRLAGPGRQ